MTRGWTCERLGVPKGTVDVLNVLSLARPGAHLGGLFVWVRRISPVDVRCGMSVPAAGGRERKCMSSSEEFRVYVRLKDVVKHGSVQAAIEDYVDEVCCGGRVGGNYRSGKSHTYKSDPCPDGSYLIVPQHSTVNDWAARALMEDDVVGYVDSTTGCVATKSEVELDGEMVPAFEWSEESIVVIEPPTFEEALEHPKHVMEMVDAGREFHDHLIDAEAWTHLLAKILGVLNGFKWMHDMHYRLMVDTVRCATKGEAP